MARALRAQPELDGHAQLWQNVQASIAATAAQSAARRGSHIRGEARRSHSAQLWTAFGSIAAVMALAVGFVAVFASHGGRPPVATKTATPIVIHSGSLTWRQVIVPQGFPSADQDQSNESATNTSATIAQSDGNTAYACQASKKKLPSPRVWATHDAGVSWSVITPTGLAENIGGCRLLIDSNAANTLIVSFYPVLSPQQPALPDQWVNYASFDGGATWTKPAGLNDGSNVDLLTSARGQVYATRTTYTPDGKAHTAFSVSSDQMQNWSQIDANLPETRPNPADIPDTGKVFEIWVNSVTGEAMALTYVGSLWSTRDNGAHWTKIAFPEGVYTDGSHAPTLMVGASTTSGFLTLCGTFTPIGSDSEQWLECTTNDGATWIKRPDLSTIGPGMANLIVSGMGADGSFYALRTDSANTGNGNQSFYRLPPQATSTADWQWLGEIPNSKYGFGSQIAPAGDHTVIWLFPGITTVRDSSGSKTYTQPNYYVATYP